MAKGFKHGAGGANPLNFKVVGNPQPQNPNENTIWVDTDTKITSKHFSAQQPTEPQEGMVWISTGSSSTVEFNALKKNGIQVYPISAKQYVGGVWVSKTAKFYQNGVWVDCGQLFSDGVMSDKLMLTSTANGSVSVVNNRLQFRPGTVTRHSCWASTKEKIDVSKIDTLTVKISSIGSSEAYLAIGVTSQVTDLKYDADFVSVKACKAVGVHTVELPSSGDYYLTVAATGIYSIEVEEMYYR